MSDWTDRIKNHPVWQKMEALGPVLDEALSKDGIEPPAIEGLERIRAVLTFVGKRLGGADAQLVPPNSLGLIASGLEKITTEISAYIGDGVAGHIANANTNADEVLSALPGVNYPFVADDWIALSAAAAAYRGTLENALERSYSTLASIETDAEGLRGQLSKLRADLEAEQAKLAAMTPDFQAKFTKEQGERTTTFTEQIHTAIAQVQSESVAVQQHLVTLAAEIVTERGKITTVVTELQTQFLKEQEKRGTDFASQAQAAIAQFQSDSSSVQQKLAELAAEITAERAKLTTVATEFQSQFSAVQESRSREFAETQTKRQETFGTLIATYNQRLTDQDAILSKQREQALQEHLLDLADLNKKYADSAREILDKIEKDKTAVEKLVGVIGNLGVTSGYLRTANYARIMTAIWQIAAVISMGTLIGFAYKAFLPLMQGAFNWETFAGRVFLTLTVGVLAAYAANQGDKYLKIEQRNRKLALELEAIGPYISPLPIEKQEQFRLDVGDRTFGRDDLDSHRIDKSPATVLDLLKSDDNIGVVAKFLRVLMKKSP